MLTIEEYILNKSTLITNYKQNDKAKKYSKYKNKLYDLNNKNQPPANCKNTSTEVLNKICLTLLLAAIECENNLNYTPSDRKDKLFRTYLSSYPSICKYFKFHNLNKYSNKKNISEKDIFLQSILMIYGWMPRIPNINLDKFSNPEERIDHIISIGSTKTDKADINSAIKFLKDLRTLNPKEAYDTIKNESNEINNLKLIIDNSLTATSKILHFTRPNEFPIWDSTIRKALEYKTNKKNEISLYQKYISNFEHFRKKYEKEIFKIIPKQDWPRNLPLSRIVELTIFINARKTK